MTCTQMRDFVVLKVENLLLGQSDGMDKIEDTHAENEAFHAERKGGVVGGAAGAGTAVASSRSKDAAAEEEGQEYDEDDEEEPEKKSRFGFFGNFAAAVATAAKETVATELLGDDFGEGSFNRTRQLYPSVRRVFSYMLFLLLQS